MGEKYRETAQESIMNSDICRNESRWARNVQVTEPFILPKILCISMDW